MTTCMYLTCTPQFDKKVLDKKSSIVLAKLKLDQHASYQTRLFLTIKKRADKIDLPVETTSFESITSMSYLMSILDPLLIRAFARTP